MVRRESFTIPVFGALQSSGAQCSLLSFFFQEKLLEYSPCPVPILPSCVLPPREHLPYENKSQNRNSMRGDSCSDFLGKHQIEMLWMPSLRLMDGFGRWNCLVELPEGNFSEKLLSIQKHNLHKPIEIPISFLFFHIICYSFKITATVMLWFCQPFSIGL